MKAVSLWQPWASLVAIGVKRIETRSWPTSYRGPLAIHATKRWTRDVRRLCLTSHFAKALEEGGLKAAGRASELCLPLGMIVAVCELAHCVEIPAGCKVEWRQGEFLPPEGMEFHFGNYTPGRFAWILESVRRLDKPIATAGFQRMFNWTPPADWRRP